MTVEGKRILRSRDELEQSAAALEALYQCCASYMVYRLKREPESPLLAKVEVVSPSIKTILGASDPNDLSTWFAAIHPDDQEKLMKSHRACFHHGVPFDEVLRVRDGEAIRYVHVISHPILDEDGEALYYNGLVVDVTERTLAQREAARLRDQLEHAQRWEAVGALASSIAHDFNNLLQGILGTTLLLKPEIVKEDLQEFQKEMKILVERGSRMTRDLLAFAGSTGGELESRDIRESIHRVARLVRSMFGELELLVIFKTDLPNLLLDDALFEQALLNLCVNAAHASDEEGSVTLWVDCLTAERVNELTGFEVSDSFVDICVQDRGCGIEKEHLELIFEHFFTTKPAGKGTGLGLAAVKRAAGEHGGFIHVDSTPGEGSSFHFFIPASFTEASPPLEEEQVPPALSAGEKILLVDDEPSLRLVLSRLLTKEGFKVEAVASCSEALTALKTTQKPFNLLITDLVMPGPDGLELLRQVRSLYPSLPVLVATGDIGTRHLHEIHNQGKSGFLAKPFGTEQFYEALRLL